VIGPGAGDQLGVTRLGPSAWAATIDGQVATHWEEWPRDKPITDLFDDNAIVDLIIVIHRNGSFSLHDVHRGWTANWLLNPGLMTGLTALVTATGSFFAFGLAASRQQLARHAVARAASDRSR
jgi:hypothetical protein